MHLTTEGIIFMILGWGFAFSLTIFCFSRVLRTKTRYDDESDEKKI